MSFKDGDYGQKFRQGNKRRVQRVCDACRRRKSRCDGWQISEDKCTKCRDAGFDCTYFEYIAVRRYTRSSLVCTQLGE
ncbi:hypothetical protein B0H19DRAFT_653843 [Mycena capillaripes]|nr:hypothetical protein B0H19DRAFT_653843 [Mycena capillaripes]